MAKKQSADAPDKAAPEQATAAGEGKKGGGKGGVVPLRRGIQLLKGLKRAKFDETVEVHMSLGIDATQSDQMIRGSVPLPHGVGKSVRVLVFSQGDDVQKAKDAGADYAG